MATTKRATATRKKAMVVDEGAKGGFTIIEVVLVLAIAGLIFLMVFLALPALQRSQRDSERQRMLGNLSAQVRKYQQNNNGRLPNPGSFDAVADGDAEPIDTWCTGTATNTAKNFICNYMNGADAQHNEWLDPTGYAYGLTIKKLTNGEEVALSREDYEDHMVYLLTSARCGDDEKGVYSSNSRDFVVMYKLEGSGTYCE